MKEGKKAARWNLILEDTQGLVGQAKDCGLYPESKWNGSPGRI